MDKTEAKSQEKKPVILQVLPELQSGGVERGTVEVVRALVSNGFQAIVASSGGHMALQVEAAGGLHITMPLKSKNLLTIKNNARKLRKLIEKYNVDIVHARSRAPAWSAYKACKKTGCHFVTTVHGPYSGTGTIKKRYNSVMMRGERVIAISEFIKHYIVDNYDTGDSEIVVIHRGVDLHYFDRDLVPKSRIVNEAHKLNIELERTVIMLPGRMTEWKGHEFLLDALARIPKEKYMCLLVGDTKDHAGYVQRLQDKVEELELQGSVRFVSHVRDMPAMYGLADIVVSASLRPEAFGRVAVEAQAMERLTIATNHGGACETVIDGKTGWLVEPGDVDALVQALEKVMALSDKQRKTITNRAKRHIQENFSLDKMTASTLDVYRDILGTKPKGVKKNDGKRRKVAG